MKIIGISPLDKDSTVSFMEDGQVLFACGEERLTRTKLQGGFPTLAMKMGFEKTGWTAANIDAVAYAFFDADEEARLMRESVAIDKNYHNSDCTSASLQALKKLDESGYKPDLSTQIPGLDVEKEEFMPPKGFPKSQIYSFSASNAKADWALHKKFYNSWLKQAIADHQQIALELSEGLKSFNLEGKLKRFNHHDTHAANAFYSSGYDEALLVTLDGYGSGNCGGVYEGNSAGLTPLIKFSFPNSLGQFYEMVTSALGFKPVSYTHLTLPTILRV